MTNKKQDIKIPKSFCFKHWAVVSFIFIDQSVIEFFKNWQVHVTSSPFISLFFFSLLFLYLFHLATIIAEKNYFSFSRPPYCVNIRVCICVLKRISECVFHEIMQSFFFFSQFWWRSFVHYKEKEKLSVLDGCYIGRVSVP